MSSKICIECGKTFSTSHLPQKYCSRWCAAHSQKLKDVQKIEREFRAQNFQNHFWERVDKTSDCWIWTGAITRAGYGWVRAWGTSRLAHRVAWELTNGSIPAGIFICHKCDNRICVNPNHHFLGTDSDNMHDCSVKGRTSWGEKSAHAKLKSQQVMEIRKLYKLGCHSYQSIAEEFGIGMVTVANIITGVTWNKLKEQSCQ